ALRRRPQPFVAMQANRQSSPLFPYTTLFRSPVAPDLTATLKDYHGDKQVEQGEAFDPSPANIESRSKRLTLASGMEVALLSKKTDRKSTRLNSSHGSISYAVFCLKKKITHLLSTAPTAAQNQLTAAVTQRLARRELLADKLQFVVGTLPRARITASPIVTQDDLLH